MDPENTRSRPPSGLFSDDSSASTDDARRSVSGAHPYRGTRESLLARRHALEKELAAVDSSLEEQAADGAEAPARTMELSDLGAIFLPRRAVGVVMAGVLTGVCVSSMLAYQLGACWTASEPEARVFVSASRRSHAAPLEESWAQHALRRRKEGEALLMSSLFAASPEPATAAPARITRIGPTTWEVEETALAVYDAPYAAVRMVPHFSREGRVDGIRVFGIRSDSVQARLGLHNGDVVLRANGIPMTGADGAFAAVDSMRRTHYLVLDLEREGQLLAQHYLIVAH